MTRAVFRGEEAPRRSEGIMRDVRAKVPRVLVAKFIS